MRALQRRRRRVAIRFRAEVEVRDGEAAIRGATDGFHGVCRGLLDGFPGAVLPAASTVVVQRLRVTASLQHLQLPPHISQRGGPSWQLGDLRTKRASLGAQGQVLGFDLLAQPRELCSSHIRAVVDDGEESIRLLGEVEELFLTVDANREAFADIAFLGDALVTVKARDRRRASLLVPGEKEPLAVLAVRDLHYGVGCEEALLGAVGRDPHAFVERRAQGGFAAAIQLTLSTKGGTAEIDESRFAGAATANQDVEPGVEADGQRIGWIRLLPATHVLRLSDRDALDGVVRVLVGVAGACLLCWLQRAHAIQQGEAKPFGIGLRHLDPREAPSGFIEGVTVGTPYLCEPATLGLGAVQPGLNLAALRI